MTEPSLDVWTYIFEQDNLDLFIKENLIKQDPKELIRLILINNSITILRHFSKNYQAPDKYKIFDCGCSWCFITYTKNAVPKPGQDKRTCEVAKHIVNAMDCYRSDVVAQYLISLYNLRHYDHIDKIYENDDFLSGRCNKVYAILGFKGHYKLTDYIKKKFDYRLDDEEIAEFIKKMK